MADHNNSPDLGDELDTAATTSEQWGFGGLQTHGTFNLVLPSFEERRAELGETNVQGLRTADHQKATEPNTPPVHPLERGHSYNSTHPSAEGEGCEDGFATLRTLKKNRCLKYSDQPNTKCVGGTYQNGVREKLICTRIVSELLRVDVGLEGKRYVQTEEMGEYFSTLAQKSTGRVGKISDWASRQITANCSLWKETVCTPPSEAHEGHDNQQLGESPQTGGSLQTTVQDILAKTANVPMLKCTVKKEVHCMDVCNFKGVHYAGATLEKPTVCDPSMCMGPDGEHPEYGAFLCQQLALMG